MKHLITLVILVSSLACTCESFWKYWEYKKCCQFCSEDGNTHKPGNFTLRDLDTKFHCICTRTQKHTYFNLPPPIETEIEDCRQ